MYTLYPTHVVRLEDGACIPIDEENADWAAFVAWRAAGNVPSLPPSPTTDEKRSALLAAVTARRWEVETGGITLPSGIRVLTGKADQNRITSVLVNAQAAGIEVVDFKADSGWARLSIAEITAIACAIGRHVQACFSAERAHHEAIAQLDAVGIDAYDLSAGWPVTNFMQGA